MDPRRNADRGGNEIVNGRVRVFYYQLTLHGQFID